MQVINDQSESVHKLAGTLDVNTANEVRGVLLEYLGEHTSISIDLSQVEGCDAAGVQLLLALEKSAEAAGKPFAVVASSEAFDRDCAGLGISTAFPATMPVAHGKPRAIATKKSRNRTKKKKSTQNLGEGSDA
jgi:anti-anti-sigma factor